MERNRKWRLERRPQKEKELYHIDYVSWIRKQRERKEGSGCSKSLMQRVRKIFLSVFLLIGLVACMDYHEVESVTIVSGIGVQMDGEEVVVYLELIEKGRIPSEGEGIRVLMTRGKSFGDAMRNIVLQSGKEPYFGHVQVLIVDEGMLGELHHVVDDLLTQKEIRYDLQIVGARNAIASLFEQQEQLRAFDLYELLKRNRYYATSVSLRLLDFMGQRQNSYLLPLITMEEEQPTLHEGAIWMARNRKYKEVDASFVRAYLMLDGLFESSLEMIAGDQGEKLLAQLTNTSVKYKQLEERATIGIEGTLMIPGDDTSGVVKRNIEELILAHVRVFLLENEMMQLLDLKEKLSSNRLFVSKQAALPNIIDVKVSIEVKNSSNVRRGS